MKLSLCLNVVNASRTDAMRLAKSIGYDAVEYWEGKDYSVDEYKQTLTETGLTVTCAGFATGLVDPATREDFLQQVKTSVENAKIIGNKGIIATTGQELPGVSREEQHQSIVDGLCEVAALLAGTDYTLLLEPLNVLVNHKGYYLYSSTEGFEILRKVNSPNVKMLFDIYHQQVSEGQLIANITQNIDLIGHFHVAGNPGRGEPYFGEINYAEVFTAIDATGYSGYAGLEYWAKSDTVEDSLKRCLELYG